MATKAEIENAKRQGSMKHKITTDESEDSNEETVAELAVAATTSSPLSRKVAKVEKRKIQVTKTAGAKPPQKKQRRPSDDEEEEDDNEEDADEDDEATYCLCNQVAYGEMVLCDNDNCLNQWYHFECVDLHTKPKGKWYCPICRGARSNMAKTTTYSNNKI